jgi:hypothetical protein
MPPPPDRRRQPPAGRRAARPRRLRPRRRLEPGRHRARLRLRGLHGARVGLAVGPGAVRASGRPSHATLARRCLEDAPGGSRRVPWVIEHARHDASCSGR